MTKKSKKYKKFIHHQKITKKTAASPKIQIQDGIFQQALSLQQAGRFQDAESLYKQILRQNPNHPESLHYLGILYHQTGRNEIAIQLIKKALVYRPDFADSHYSLGLALLALGMLKEAEASFSKTIDLNPAYVNAHYNLGIVRMLMGKLDGAEKSLQRAISLQPDYAELHCNLGTVLNYQGKLDEAIASFNRAIYFKPDFAMAFFNRGNVLTHQLKIDEAITSFQRAINIKPDYAEAHSNLLLYMNYLPKFAQEDLYRESLRWNERIGSAIPSETIAYRNSLETDRRLRVGYVSADFRLHSVLFFIEPIIRQHNRESVEVFCYCNVKNPDNETRHLQEITDNWISITGMDPQAVAARIISDRIDILVDLAGHTNNNSLLVFMRKPAPIQVTWLGYPNTTGLRTMDYRLTDAVADPPGEADKLHSEKLVRLEHGFLCYQALSSAPEVGPMPCRENGYITFGSFNNLAKVPTEVVKTWAKILLDVPDSHLVLKAAQLRDSQVKERFIELFTQEGVAKERVEMHARVANYQDHLELYNRVDIGLDSFPYNGTTTTCEALWMGVPVVTLLGDRHAGRVGASILHRIGLDDLVASSIEKYIQLAESLAFDRKHLEEMRSGLRARMKESELMDSELFTANLEGVYREMWKKYVDTCHQGNKVN